MGTALIAVGCRPPAPVVPVSFLPHRTFLCGCCGRFAAYRMWRACWRRCSRGEAEVATPTHTHPPLLHQPTLTASLTGAHTPLGLQEAPPEIISERSSL
jgi:hypothetical protein